MAPEAMDRGPLDAGFSSAKKRILMMLKRTGTSSLADVAKELGVTKMAALRHVNVLEGKGLVGRSFVAGGRGRPQVFFRLAPGATRLFPEAYTQMTLAALAFVEEKLGPDAVTALLKQRAQEVYAEHRPEMEDKDLKERVRTLARIRDEGGYMAEIGAARKGTFELLEHNCPIFAVAGTYGEACAVEQELFQKLLRADVETSHRVVAGDSVCRFLIRTREAKNRGR